MKTMKLRRLVSATLALLLVVSILPLGAMAEGTIEAGTTVNTNENNLQTNKGTIVNNGTAGGSNEYAEVEHNAGTIENNYANVGYNGNLIENNQSGGVVYINEATGTIQTNQGTVGAEKSDGTVNTDTGNFGTIEENFGTVLINQEGGTVETNTDTGTVKINQGTVGKENEDGSVVDGSGNSGTININDGKVLTNCGTGIIETNNGTVRFSSGEITTNNGTVSVNSPDGTVGTNNGYVGNCGTVETNAIDGIVRNEPAQDQGGNSITGKVNANYGTVYDYDAETKSYVTIYGVQVQNTDGGAGKELLPAVHGIILKLADLFQRDGYELVGYEEITPNPDKEDYPGEDIPAELALNPDPDIDTPELSATDFQVYHPSILSLIWKSIAKPASSGGAGDAGPAVLTRLSADKVRVGTLIRCGNLIFKIIEVNDDSIRVATVCMLSQQNQEDMMGYLKQYLSAAQIDKFIGQPELLDADEIAEFFGDNRAHIAFYAAKDLFDKN